ncbi:hypothetical protein PVAND_005408 [Polypedilum vanderplanki]|uniref:Lipocalin/cytosolic fatty-acid binding domain-containing protein n=1 Tax=Polypedilum vanderplanki TaxID=319348 RepID=A0A9J6C0T1_POLVA|nr:hypothetical protein PVAND_005408 [Polypedilum vanderplanki]
MKVVLIIFGSFLIKSSIALEYNFGSCPKVKPIESESIGNFTGKWYDVWKYTSMFMKSKCMRMDIEATSDSTVSITTTEVKNGQVITGTREGEIESNGAVEFNFTFLKLKVKFYILGTDFEHYLVAYACKSVAKMANVQMAWIWSRTPELQSKYLEKAFEVLYHNGISTDELVPSEQEKC